MLSPNNENNNLARADAFSLKLQEQLNATQLLRQHYRDWLSHYPFEWFITLTFRYNDTPEHTARSMLRRLVERTQRELFGKHKARRVSDRDHKLSMVAFEERNESNGLHYHCLVQPPTALGKLATSAELPRLLYKNWVAIGGGYIHDSQPIANRVDVATTIDYGVKQLAINSNCVNLTWFQQRTG